MTQVTRSCLGPTVHREATMSNDVHILSKVEGTDTHVARTLWWWTLCGIDADHQVVIASWMNYAAWENGEPTCTVCILLHFADPINVLDFDEPPVY